MPQFSRTYFSDICRFVEEREDRIHYLKVYLDKAHHHGLIGNSRSPPWLGGLIEKCWELSAMECQHFGTGELRRESPNIHFMDSRMKNGILQPFLSMRLPGFWTNVPSAASIRRGGGAGVAIALVFGITPRLFAARP